MSTISFDTQELPYLNPEFIGIGKTLESKRKQRRTLREEEKMLENKVAFFEKEDRKTAKSIEENRKTLERIMEIRQRREEERKQKRLKEYLNQQELNRLRLQSEFERKTHQNNKQQAMDKLLKRNKNTFETIKGKIERDLSEKKQLLRKERRFKQENFEWIENLKNQGHNKYVTYWKEKNAEAVKNYKSMIEQEQAVQNQIKTNMNNLQQRQNELVNKLQKSYLQKQRLEAAIQNAYDVEFHELQTLLSDRTQSLRKDSRAISTGFRTTRNSHLTGGSNKIDRSGSPDYMPLAITMNSFHPKRHEAVSESLTKKKHKSKRKKPKAAVDETNNDN